MTTIKRWAVLSFVLLASLARTHAYEPNLQAIAVDDLVEVKVYQEEDLTTRARVSKEGTINVPLVGVVAIAGKSPQAAGEVIRKRLAERFLLNPQVNLAVTEYARKLFTVLGQVQRAGTYRFPDHEMLNVIQAIGMAGGYTRIADSTRVTLKRRVAGKETVLTLDARKMARKASSEPVALQSGDIITVAERLF